MCVFACVCVCVSVCVCVCVCPTFACSLDRVNDDLDCDTRGSRKYTGTNMVADCEPIVAVVVVVVVVVVLCAFSHGRVQIDRCSPAAAFEAKLCAGGDLGAACQ